MSRHWIEEMESKYKREMKEYQEDGKGKTNTTMITI